MKKKLYMRGGGPVGSVSTSWHHGDNEWTLVAQEEEELAISRRWESKRKPETTSLFTKGRRAKSTLVCTPNQGIYIGIKRNSIYIKNLPEVMLIEKSKGLNKTHSMIFLSVKQTHIYTHKTRSLNPYT